jgi:exopolysaccharide biosynthesis predicted pyruvyltransferase EpsI
MLHGLGQTTLDLCSRAALQHRLRLVRCDAKTGPFDDGFVLPDPAGWLRQIKGASFVATNSFHGVVFCLIFHVSFVAILIENEMASMNSRIMDLLHNVGLSHRIMKADEEISEALFREKIDWERVDDKIDEMRDQSINFLEKQDL